MPNLFSLLYRKREATSQERNAFQALDTAGLSMDDGRRRPWVVLHLIYRSGRSEYYLMPQSMAKAEVDDIKASPAKRLKVERVRITRWGDLPPELQAQVQVRREP